MLLLLPVFLLIILNLFSNTFAAPTETWNKRPSQFRMQVYSRPFRKGTVQHIRTYIEGIHKKKEINTIESLHTKSLAPSQSPCWNLSSKRVGSYELNDPLVKVTFYRVSKKKNNNVGLCFNLAFSLRIVKALHQPFIKIQPFLGIMY